MGTDGAQLMPRHPATNPIAPRAKRKPRCIVCGFEIKRPRDEKRCSRCRETLPQTAFGHTNLRTDHRETYCGLPAIGGNGCKSAIQNSKRLFKGSPQPISDFSPPEVGASTAVVLGTFVSQGPLTAWREVPSSIAPVLVQYRTMEDRKPLYELTIAPPHRPTGTSEDDLKIVHTFADLATAPFQPGDQLAVVYQGGEVAKVLRAGDEWPIVDTSLDITEDETSEIGLRFGSFLPARPWMLGLALEFILGDKPKETGCPFCGNEQGEIEDFTLKCPNCTNDLRWSADVILAEELEGIVEPELIYEFLSKLEDDWLMSQIPMSPGRHGDVPAEPAEVSA